MYQIQTFALIRQQAIGSAHFNMVANLHAFQMLRHLSSIRELGMNVLKVYLQGAHTHTHMRKTLHLRERRKPAQVLIS